MGIDLHVHSTCSDGAKTPDELARMAQKLGLSHLALCDHDSVLGVEPIRKALAGSEVALLPGVEVSTGEGGSTHILCYGEAVLDAPMRAFLSELAQERVGRAETMLHRLREQGIPLSDEHIQQALAHPCVGRPHIARLLISLGVASTIKQAFDHYLMPGRPAYVPRRVHKTSDVVRIVRGAGAVPVLAHPLRMGLEWPAMHAFVRSLMDCGLMGLEAFHPSATPPKARQLDKLARDCGLLVTGGSDYHADPASTVHMGRLPAGWHTRESDLSALLSATNTKGATHHA